MTYHDALSDLAKRFRLYMPIPGLLAAAVYLLTLSRGTAPGLSASLSAAAAGLNAPSEASHPLFAWAARLAASNGLFTLPTRLNLFSALCGALCVMLAYHLVARLVLFSACRDAGTGGRSDEPRRRASAEPTEQPTAPAEDAAATHSPRIIRYAVWSGLLAAAFLAFSAPLWSASTHLDRGPFDLLVALIAASLFPVTRGTWRTPRLLASVALFTCGLLESPVFLLLLPVYAAAVLKVCFASHRRFALLGQLALAGAAGLLVMLAAYRLNSESAASLSGAELLGAFARAAPFNLYREAKGFFPAAGWAFPALQVGMVAALALLGRRALFHQRRLDTLIVLALLALLTVPGLLLAPLAPHCTFAPADRLPVFAHAVLALGAALAFAACLVARAAERRAPPADDDPKGKRRPPARGGPAAAIPVLATALAPLLMLAALLSPWRNYTAVRAGRGAFADAVARALLESLDGRTCLVTDGALDNNLRLLAATNAPPLVLVNIGARNLQSERQRLQGALDTHPAFTDANRLRLQNALSISPLRFLTEWLGADTNAYRRVLVEAAPDLWTACGFRPVPEGLAFGGLRAGEAPDAAGLAARSRRFAERVAPLLDPGADTRPGPYDALRRMLQLRLGLAANELGVLLEELGRPEDAYRAYSDAFEIDPQNVSAALNACALAVTKQLHPESHDALNKRVKHLLAELSPAARSMAAVVQRYGSVRHPAFYQEQARRWEAAGTHVVATAKMRKALELSEQAGSASLLAKAYALEQLGDAARAEACYRDALADNGSKAAALLGLGRLALAAGDPARAEPYLQQAAAAGAEPDALLSPTIDLALLKKELPRARSLLTDATSRHPDSPRYWGLLADVMARQGDALAVKQSLLPQMQKALKPRDRYLVHAIRGTLLIRSGPAQVKEGRLELLKALTLNAAQPNVWNAVLSADMVLNNPAFTETDARGLLAIDPDHALANCLMGSVLLARGELPRAEDFFRRSLARSPSAAACNDLAETLRLLKRPGEAEPLARQALALDPAQAAAHDTLANILCDLDNLPEAAREAERAVESDPKRPAFALTRLRVLIAQRDTDAARRQLQTLERAKIAVPAELREAFRQL